MKNFHNLILHAMKIHKCHHTTFSVRGDLTKSWITIYARLMTSGKGSHLNDNIISFQEDKVVKFKISIIRTYQYRFHTLLDYLIKFV